MDVSLQGRHALVCGASRGIGEAIAVELAALGAEVTVVARSRERLEAVVRGLATDHGQSHRVLVADFANPDTLEDRVLALVARHPVQVLVNNTGGPPPGEAYAADVDEYTDAFRKHLVCNQLLVRSTLPGMKDAGYGRVINIISTSVKIPIDGLGVSNTIRGAVASWAKTLANELGRWGVTVNNVLPGFTQTGRLDALIHGRAAATGMTVEDTAEGMRATVPLGRFGRPAEVANAVAFLASPAAAYISGVNLPVDGGRTGAL